MINSNKVLQKGFSIFTGLSLIFQSLLPGLSILTNPVYAEEITPIAEQTITPTETSTPTPVPETNGDLNTYVAQNVEADSVDLNSIDPENAEQTAQLATDKADYAPTDTVIITGIGFIAGQTYILEIFSTDTPPVTTEVEVTADENGQFVYAYQLDDNLRPNYTVTAKTLSGEEVAQTSFTDAANTVTTLSSITTPLTTGQTNVPFSGTVKSPDSAGTIISGRTVELRYVSGSNCPSNRKSAGAAIATVTTTTSEFSGTFTAPSANTYQFWASHIGDSSYQDSVSDCQTIVINSVSAVCGNGVLESGEQCDDGNTTNGDCCSSTCQYESASTVCRASSGACDVAETCTGTGATCPADSVRSNGYVCAVKTGQCDANDTCDGTTKSCNEAYASSGTSCNDGLFCNIDETCNGAGACTGGSARSCSGNNIAGIATCDNDPDNIHCTFDFRNSFTSTCDEDADICTSGDQTIAHTCNKATCGAECDQNSDCTPKFDGDSCKYGGTCNTDPASCSCNYASSQYCPTPGTINSETCYYGTQSCTESGCGLTTEAMGNYDTCDSVLGPIDTIPPVIAAHGDETVEATSASGAIVVYTSPATTDAVDGPGVATCLPASGSTFALGDTTVTCNAEDAAGNDAIPTTFVVHVVDTTPPVVTVPSDITEEATSPSGNVVTFTATANDIVDGSITPTCLPASSSTFAITTTLVTCSATDAHGNTGSASFNVIVQDTTPPTTTDNIPLAWQTAPFDVTFICTDSGSGCSKVYYTTDGTGPTTSSLFVDAASSWKFNVAADGVYTIKYRGEDAVGNLENIKTAANQLRIDQVAPVTTLTIGIPNFGTDPRYVSLTTDFTLGATDTGSDVDYTEYHFDSDGWAQYNGAFNAPGLGNYTLYYRSVDNAGNIEDTQSENIVVGATTLTNNGVYSGQFSDSVTLSATLIDKATNAGLSGKTITFTIGTQSVSGTTDAIGVATASITLNQPAGNYNVVSTFAGDSGNQGNSDIDAFIITKEDAAITYNGDILVFTAGPTISTAPILLSAHLDQLDNELGDITLAKVTFILIPSTGSPIIVPNVSVNNAGDALFTKTVPIEVYSIHVKISFGNQYWTQNPAGTGSLTVAKGDNEQRVTGGGWIQDSLSANGKDNFGFTVYYNKNGAPKGNFLFMFRGTDGYNYQVKSNSWAKGGLSFNNTNGAYFTGKCTIQKIDRASGEVVESLGGDFTFAVNIKDGDLFKPAVKDMFAITIFDSSKNIWKQVGTAGSQITLGGGNIVVHSK